MESRHRGSISVVDADGGVVFSLGDVDRPVFPRSAVKALQALPLIESGIAEQFGLTDEEIALACASHSGEPRHVAAAEAMLAKAGRDASCLECGAHWPSGEAASRALAASGAMPTALHNNCSGKHAGFICLACGAGTDPAGYIKAGHGPAAGPRGAGRDHRRISRRGELRHRRLLDPDLRDPAARAWPSALPASAPGPACRRDTAKAAARIRKAVASHPFMVAGTDRFDTKVMEILGERAFIKVGAEGVYCAALPELGYGIALKIDDGGTRAAEAAMGALLLRYLDLGDEERRAIEGLAEPALRNRNGIEVGQIRAGADLATSAN